MSKNVTLQIPMAKELKLGTEKKAKRYGFSSLQEFIRFMLTQFEDNRFVPSIVSNDEYITPEAEERLLRYSRELEEDIKMGRAYEANSVEELMQHLNTKDD